MVREPPFAVPKSKVVLPIPWIAVRTFSSWTFSRTRLPLVKVALRAWLVRTPIGVLEMELSMKVAEPTVCDVGDSLVMFRPTLQLLILMDWNVQPMARKQREDGVRRQSRRRQTPVPDHIDRIVGVINDEVADGELLISKAGGILPTVEGQITHEATGS